MPAIILTLFGMLKGPFEFIIKFATSTLGQFIIVGFVGWFIGDYRADRKCADQAEAARRVAEAAAHQQIIDWKNAAIDIADEATKRVEEEAKKTGDQQIFINEVVKGYTNDDPLSASPTDWPRFLDPDYVSVVREFDASANRKTGASKAPTKFWKARSVAKSEGCAALKVWGLRNRMAAAQANRRLVNDFWFYRDVLNRFSATPIGESEP